MYWNWSLKVPDLPPFWGQSNPIWCQPWHYSGWVYVGRDLEDRRRVNSRQGGVRGSCLLSRLSTWGGVKLCQSVTLWACKFYCPVGISDLAPMWVRLTPNVTNTGIFISNFSTEVLSEKVPGCGTFGDKLTLFRLKSEIPGHVEIWTFQRTVDQTQDRARPMNIMAKITELSGVQIVRCVPHILRCIHHHDLLNMVHNMTRFAQFSQQV